MDNDKRAKELFDRIEADHSDCIIVFSDTHRWMETDNFYEMAVYVVKDGHEHYIHTIYDRDGDTEKEYSENNPQVSSYVYEAYYMLDFDGYDFVLDDFEHFLNGDYDKIRNGYSTGKDLEYQKYL